MTDDGIPPELRPHRPGDNNTYPVVCPECGNFIVQNDGVVVRHCHHCNIAWHRDSVEMRPLEDL